MGAWWESQGAIARVLSPDGRIPLAQIFIQEQLVYHLPDVGSHPHFRRGWNLHWLRSRWPPSWLLALLRPHDTLEKMTRAGFWTFTGTLEC